MSLSGPQQRCRPATVASGCWGAPVAAGHEARRRKSTLSRQTRAALAAKRAQGTKLGNPRNIRSAGQLGSTALIASDKETLVCLPMDREGYHIGGQSCYRALSSSLRTSGSLHPSVKSNDCWNRMASAVEPPAGTVPSI
jgi:hypothetical protein